MHHWAFGLSKLAAGILIVFAPAQAQPVSDKIVSEHVRLRIPVEREWLGRDSIMDLERCWRFMNGATGERLPRKILVVIAWDKQSSFADPDLATISIGMNDPAAPPNLRRFLIHSAAREMARMGLLELARGIADREGSEFLFEGMSEILAREYDHSARSLESAWVVAHFLDRMKLLGLKAQSRWSEFSGGRQDPLAILLLQPGEPSLQSAGLGQISWPGQFDPLADFSHDQHAQEQLPVRR